MKLILAVIKPHRLDEVKEALRETGVNGLTSVDAQGFGLARRRTEAVDRAVRALFAPFGSSGVTLAALGGYGREELTPRSDIDLLFLHPGLGEASVRPVLDAVLYPLWDAGMRVSHAV